MSNPTPFHECIPYEDGTCDVPEHGDAHGWPANRPEPMTELVKETEALGLYEHQRIPLPTNWFLGAHGDPVAQFNYVELVLLPDGEVQWRSTKEDQEITVNEVDDDF